MPIQYTGILDEHKQTRTSAAIFDICHMGEFFLSGPKALEALSRIVTHNLETLAPGRCRYGFLLNPDGGILDDLIVYRLAEEQFMLVVNAATTPTDFAWIKERLPSTLSFDNRSDSIAKIDLQGPASLAALESTLGIPFRQLKYFNFMQMTFEGVPLLVSRTGYTGELGYELYVDVAKAEALWERCLADDRVRPAGLGARDTLRLEVGLPLYGQDLDTCHTPAEAGYGALLTSSADYVGKGKDQQIRERLVGLAIPGRRSARHHDAVLLPSGEKVGHVTSGSFSPLSRTCRRLGLYPGRRRTEGESFVVQTAKVALEAQRATLPFYSQGTARQQV